MSSFISNFKKFRHTFIFLLLLTTGIVLMGTVNLVIRHIRREQAAPFAEEQLFDDFFGRKCQDAVYPVIVYGDSRAYNGVNPYTVSEMLERPCMNLAFSSGGMNEEMMRFIDTRIDRKSPGKAVVILGITPYSLTENARKNECFREYSKKFRQKGQNIFLSPEGRPWYEIAIMPLPKVLETGSFKSGKIHRSTVYTKRYHDNGWVETTVNGDTATSIAQTLKLYRERDFNNNPLSRHSVDELLKWIAKWSAEGITVVAFRPPTCIEMEEIEAQQSGFDTLQIDRKIRAAGGRWLTCPTAEYVSYDASHLDAAGAEKLSRSIARAILAGE